MGWQTSAILIGVIVVAALIPIIVLVVKLRSANRRATDQWTRAERAVRDHERTSDELARLVERIGIEGMSDEGILSGLRADLDSWSASDGPEPADGANPSAGA